MNLQLVDELIKCPDSPTKSSLLQRYFLLNDEIKTHLASHTEAQVREFEIRRDALSNQGRQVEERIADLRRELGGDNSWQNSLAEQINMARAKLSAVIQANPSYRTHFPTEKEIANWASERSAAQERVDTLTREFASIKGAGQLTSRQGTVRTWISEKGFGFVGIEGGGLRAIEVKRFTS